MRVLLPLAAVVAAAVAAAAVAAPAAGPPTISLISTTTSLRVKDRPPKGPSVGDVYTETSTLRNAMPQFGMRRGVIVGTDRAVTTLTGKRSARVVAVVKLPGGTLRVSGTLRPQPDGSVAAPVVSGSGLFAGARGTLIVAGNEKRAVNLYRLTYLPVA